MRGRRGEKADSDSLRTPASEPHALHHARTQATPPGLLGAMPARHRKRRFLDVRLAAALSLGPLRDPEA